MGWMTHLAMLLVAVPALDPHVASPAALDSEPIGPHLEVDAELTLATTYVFRGATQYGGGTIPSVQPGVTLSLVELGPGDLSLGAWAAVAVLAGASRGRRVPEAGSASEVDLTLSYDMTLAQGWLELGVGFAYYMYPEAESVDGEKEIFLTAAVGNLPITPQVSLWTEVHPTLSLYIEPGLGWEQPAGELTLGGLLTLGATFTQDEEPQMEHATFALTLTQSVSQVDLTVGVSYAYQLFKGGGSFWNRSLLYGTVGVSYSSGESPRTGR